MGMKGIVLTLDAIIAMLLMASIISLLIFFRTEQSSPFLTVQNLHSLSEDSLSMLSKSTLREVGNKTILANSTLFNMYYNQSGTLVDSDLDKKAIDVIGMLWAQNNTNANLGAANITKDILGNILPGNIGYQVLIVSGTNEYNIYNSSDTSRPSESESDAGISAGRIASGYESNKTVSGCVAMAYLSSIKGKKDSAYVYFGGYVGDGNITTNITLPNFNTIKEAYMEMDVGNNFILYVNGNFSGSYVKGSAGGGNMTADKWIVCNSTYNPSYCNNFAAGENILQINFTNRSYIGGGYFRVTYNTTELAPQEQLGYTKYRLPGIDGIINLYDSFYVPGNLSNMNISLYFKTIPSTQSLSMYIGNTLVNTSNVSPIIIPNSTLATLLNYTNLSEKTIPIRIAHYVINTTGQTGYATDVVLTTSLASQMSTVDISNGTTYIPRISAAKAVDKIFINNVLNNTGNRVGLLGYWTPGHSTLKEAYPTSPPYLSTDNNSLIAEINSADYQPNNGDRCSCCAIHTSANSILTDALRKRYILLMSDGITNTATPGCSNTRCLLITLAQYNGLDDGGKATVNEAYDAYLHNITIYTVGFGPDAYNINLMNLTAICGGGKFANSTTYNGLLQIYQNFSAEVANESLLYVYQSVVSSSINSTLFSNSSIELNYTPLIIPEDYGEISLNLEGATLGNLTKDSSIGMPCKNGTYYFPPQVSVTDAKMTSYSSNFWTDRLSVQSATGGAWNNVYNLSFFGYNYLALGDPFIVYVPYENLPVSGNNYSVCIGTGYNVSNATGGSPDDRLLYTIRVKNSVPYGNVNETCDGAITDAWQRLNDTLGGFVDFTTDEVTVLNNSIGNVPSLWGPANIRIRLWS